MSAETATKAPASGLQIVTKLLLVVTGAVCGIGAGYLIGKYVKHAGIKLQATPLDLLWLPLCWFTVVLVHELGHVFAGLASGMKFVLLTVGPLKLVNEQGRVRPRFNDAPATWGGLALMVPVSADRFRERLAWLVAGGPAASLMLAAVMGIVVANTTGHALFVAGIFGLLSALIFLGTMIPVTVGGFASDGGQLVGLLRRDSMAELRGIIATIAGASMTGTRPRDYDSALIERAVATAAQPMPRMGALLLAAMRSVDRGEAAGAYFEPLEPLYTEIPDGIRQGVAVWLAWHHAIERGDAAAAATWLARARGGLVDADQRALAEAAVAIASGDRTTAAAVVRRGLAQRAGMDPGASLLVRDLLEQIGAKAAG